MLSDYTFLVIGSPAQRKIWGGKIELEGGTVHSRVKDNERWPPKGPPLTHIILPEEHGSVRLASATRLSKTTLSSILRLDLASVESFLETNVCLISSEWIVQFIKSTKEGPRCMLPFHDKYLFKVQQQLSINEWINDKWIGSPSKRARANPKGREGSIGSRSSMAMKDGDTKESVSVSWWNVPMLPPNDLKLAEMLGIAVEDESLDLRWDWIDREEITVRIDKRQKKHGTAFQRMSFLSLSALEYICARGSILTATTTQAQVKAKFLQYNVTDYVCLVCNMPIEHDIGSFQQYVDDLLLKAMPDVALDVICCHQPNASFFRLPICGMFSFMRHARAPEAQTESSSMIVGLDAELPPYPYYKYAINLGISYQPVTSPMSGDASSDSAISVNPIASPIPAIPEMSSKPSYYKERVSDNTLKRITALGQTCCPVLEVPEDKGSLAIVHREVVLLIGPSASGKSTLAAQLIKYTDGLRFSTSTSEGASNIDKGEYVYINQDTLGNRPKCLEQSALALQNAQNVIVDNTNCDQAARQEWFDLVETANTKSHTVTLYRKDDDNQERPAIMATLRVHIRCIRWITPDAACLSMLHYRQADCYTSNEEPQLCVNLVRDVSVIDAQRRLFKENGNMDGENYERIDTIDTLVIQEPERDAAKVLFHSYMY